MYLRKKKTIKAPDTKASRSGPQIEDEPNIVGFAYNDTFVFLEKGEDSLRWATSIGCSKNKTLPLMKNTMMSLESLRTSRNMEFTG
jgi:hypothetical protein